MCEWRLPKKAQMNTCSDKQVIKAVISIGTSALDLMIPNLPFLQKHLAVDAVLSDGAGFPHEVTTTRIDLVQRWSSM